MSEWHYFSCHSSTPGGRIWGACTLLRHISRLCDFIFVLQRPKPSTHTGCSLDTYPTREETPSIPETPKFDAESGITTPEEPAFGVATKVEAAEGVTQTPPLLSRLIQGHLEQTGIEACPKHNMDHGVRDPNCEHCKRALGVHYITTRSKVRYSHLTSQPHPHRVRCECRQYLLACVWSLGDMRLVWAFGIENRQAITVLPCIQAAFEDLRSLTGGSRPPILRLRSDTKEFLPL